jgi:hypothetical protein
MERHDMDTEKEKKFWKSVGEREPGTSGVESLATVNPGALNAAAIDAGLHVGRGLTARMPCPCGSGKIYKNCCRKREGRRVNLPPVTYDPNRAARRWGDETEAAQNKWLGQLHEYVERAMPPGPSNTGHALFVLVMFDPDKPGQAVHVSNADLRQNVPEAFRQLATCFETGNPAMMPSPDSVESMALQALATLVEACDARDNYDGRTRRELRRSSRRKTTPSTSPVASSRTRRIRRARRCRKSPSPKKSATKTTRTDHTNSFRRRDPKPTCAICPPLIQYTTNRIGATTRPAFIAEGAAATDPEPFRPHPVEVPFEKRPAAERGHKIHQYAMSERPGVCCVCGGPLSDPIHVPLAQLDV